MIALRTADAASVVSAVDAELARWRFTRCDSTQASQMATELRQLYWCAASAQCPWTTLLISDIQNVFETAYCLSKALGNVIVSASRSYSYGGWQFKCYLGNDCLLRVGDDADHELKWLPRELDAARVPELVTTLGGNPTFERFLQSVISERPDRNACAQGLQLPSLDLGFPQIAAAPTENWSFASWER